MIGPWDRAEPYRSGSSTETWAIAGRRTTPSRWRTRSPRRGTPKAASEEYLVDDWWKAFDVQPVPVKAYRNSNGRRAGEPDEGQLSLFSWAEFRTEGPVKRNDKPHSASTSGIQTRTECVHSHSTKPTSRVLDADAGFAATERLGDLFGSRAAISVQTGDQPRAGQRKTLVTTTAGKRRSHAEIGRVREVVVAEEAQLEE